MNILYAIVTRGMNNHAVVRVHFDHIKGVFHFRLILENLRHIKPGQIYRQTDSTRDPTYFRRLYDYNIRSLVKQNLTREPFTNVLQGLFTDCAML